MKKSYHTINKQGKANERRLAEFLSRSGQLLLPMVDLIEQCRGACSGTAARGPEIHLRL